MHLHHLGFVVANAARAARAFPAPQFVALTAPVEDPVQRVVVQFFREESTGLVWEPIWPLGAPEDSPLQSRLSRGGGYEHVCYELDASDGTLDDVLAREVAAGSAVTCKPVHAAAFGRRVAFVFRRSGAVVEFVEPRSPDHTGTV